MSNVCVRWQASCGWKAVWQRPIALPLPHSPLNFQVYCWGLGDYLVLLTAPSEHPFLHRETELQSLWLILCHMPLNSKTSAFFEAHRVHCAPWDPFYVPEFSLRHTYSLEMGKTLNHPRLVTTVQVAGKHQGCRAAGTSPITCSHMPLNTQI